MMIQYNQTTAIPLEDAFDDCIENGIFNYLLSFSWNSSPDIHFALNSEYYYNRSGRKLASPLVLRMLDDESGTLVTKDLERLALIITARYSAKWNKLWAEYVSEVGLFDNLNVTQKLNHGHTIHEEGDRDLTKSGEESSTRKGTETRDESYPETRKSTRMITGAYTDTTNMSNTRTGTHEILESYPEARKSSKAITGSYKDTDTTANTRTGKETVTDKGDTSTTAFGFNSSTGVKVQKVGPDTSSGTTTETDYGEGVKDTRSGDVTRSYTDYKEEVTESGQTKTATSYGADGLKDSQSGGVTRTYNNYKDEVEETGKRRTEISYGTAGIVDKISFADRKDSNHIDVTTGHTGIDTTTITGYNIRRLSDKINVLTAMYENPLINNFFEIVYRDIDDILTCPIFM